MLGVLGGAVLVKKAVRLPLQRCEMPYRGFLKMLACVIVLTRSMAASIRKLS
jgi:hypothetical protein